MNSFDRLLAVLLILAAGAAFLLAGGLICWQAFTWLQEGRWPGVSLRDLFYFVHQSMWLYEPREWIGVHKAISWMPASAALFVFGAALSAVSETLLET